MNTPKIAGLYAATEYADFINWSGADADLVRQELHDRIYHLVQRDDVDYGSQGDTKTTHCVDIDDYNKTAKRYDSLGLRQYTLLSAYCPQRVHAWALRQLPAEDNGAVAPGERWTASVMTYLRDKSGEIVDSTLELRYGGAADFATLLRGMRAYQRKRQKYAKKIIAQVRAYHQQQLAAAKAEELRKLGRGHWLGSEKALTTAARVDEPGVPFMGDIQGGAGLSYEQLRALGVVFWAVPEKDAMQPAFPAGTGIALKPVKRSRELVDGAVYLWQWLLDSGEIGCSVMGRLDLSVKQRGYLPLCSGDTGELAKYCWAAWGSESVKIWQVTHYTTRNAAPQPLMQAAAQPVRKQPALRQRARRELAHAA